MAMIWESLKQQGAARRSFHAPDIDQIPADKYERLEIRDFDYDNGDSAVWHCQLQLRELFAKLPMGSRIEPDYGMWRKTWGMLGGMTTVLLIYAILTPLLGFLHPIFPSVIFGAGGFAICWWNGAKWCPTPPFWVARRLWIDGVPYMQPIIHTGLRGEPPVGNQAIAPAAKTKKAAAPKKDEEPEENVQGPPELGGPNGQHAGLTVAGFDAIPTGVYVPVVYRSTTLWQDLQMVEERQEMKMPVDKWQAIKIGGMVAFGGILILGLIFTMAVTSNS